MVAEQLGVPFLRSLVYIREPSKMGLRQFWQALKNLGPEKDVFVRRDIEESVKKLNPFQRVIEWIGFAWRKCFGGFKKVADDTAQKAERYIKDLPGLTQDVEKLTTYFLRGSNQAPENMVKSWRAMLSTQNTIDEALLNLLRYNQASMRIPRGHLEDLQKISGYSEKFKTYEDLICRLLRGRGVDIKMILKPDDFNPDLHFQIGERFVLIKSKLEQLRK